jgi:hypothetical protein
MSLSDNVEFVVQVAQRSLTEDPRTICYLHNEVKQNGKNNSLECTKKVLAFLNDSSNFFAFTTRYRANVLHALNESKNVVDALLDLPELDLTENEQKIVEAHINKQYNELLKDTVPEKPIVWVSMKVGRQTHTYCYNLYQFIHLIADEPMKDVGDSSGIIDPVTKKEFGYQFVMHHRALYSLHIKLYKQLRV